MNQDKIEAVVSKLLADIRAHREPPDINIRVAFKGRYRCVLNENTDREVDTGWFDNLVLNSGLNWLGSNSGSNLFAYACIGTGTNAAAATDTSLQAYVASTSDLHFDSQSNVGPSTYAGTMQLHHAYPQGAVVGNMAEVGVGWAAGGSSLWSRARIVDGGGTPTTLTVTSLDQLTVYYSLTCTPVLTDLTGNVTISGTSYPFTGRIADATTFMSNLFSALTGTYGQWGQMTASGGSTSSNVVQSYPAASSLGAITAEPSGTPEYSGTSAAAGYTAGNYYADSTFTLDPTQGDLTGGIGCVLIQYSSNMKYQFKFTTPIPKDNTKTFTLSVRFAWSR